MKYFDKEMTDNLERQLFNKGRDIDVALYNALSNDMFKDFLADALMLYVNEDGGIGQSFYIDNYNPNSTAYPSYQVLKTIYEYDLKSELASDIVFGIFKYLYKNAYVEEELWLKAEPENNKYPRHNDFTYPKAFSLAPSAAILGFTFLFKEGAKFMKLALNKLEVLAKKVDKEVYSEEELLNLAILVKGLKKQNLDYQKYEDIIVNNLAKMSFKDNDCILLEFANYMPLDEEVINFELDKILTNTNNLGIWDYSKNWNNEYPEGEVANIKWVGAISAKYYFYLVKYCRVKTLQ